MARKAGRFNAVAVSTVVTDEVLAVETRTYRTAFYARLSVELKMKPSDSIANQLAIMRDYTKDKAEFTDTFEYIDNGVSGTSFDRPAFQQMMEDARAGKINCIIVKDLSRFGRTYIESGNYIETILPFLGIRFISVNDHFDSEEGFNQNKSLEISLKNLVNDMYAKDISKRVACSRRMDMEKGKFVGSNAPYGYLVDSNDPLRKYVVDEQAAQVVRQIFAMALEGTNLRNISSALQSYHLSSPGEYLKTKSLYHSNEKDAKPWYIGTISTILSNQAYIGNMVQGKRRTRLSGNEKQHFTDKNEWIIVENTHEPIIDQATFYAVRDLFAKKVEESAFSSERGKNIPMKADIFDGIIYCGVCGKKIPMMSRLVDRNGKMKRQYFYQCRYNYDAGGDKKCVGSWLEAELIQLVYDALSFQIAMQYEKADAMVDELNEMLRKTMNAFDHKIKSLEKRIEKIEYSESKSYEAYVLGSMTKQELSQLQQKNAKEIADLRGQIVDETENKTREKKNLEKEIRWWSATSCMRGKASLSREIIEAMISRIELYPDKNIRITYNFKDPLAEEREKYRREHA